MTDEIRVCHYVVICPFSASWRIVRIAGSALPQTKHDAPSCVAASTDRAVQLHRDAWPINAHCRLDTRYAPRGLHFSAFHSEFGGCAIFGSIKCTASTGIAVGTSSVVRYSEDVRYWEGPLSEVPPYSGRDIRLKLKP